MILEYGGRNCWCFEDWVTINFKLNKNVPKEYGLNGTSIAPFLCFEGANASGKSSALKVLAFIRNFAAFSFLVNPDEGIQFSSFFHNEDSSDFYVKFSLSDNLDEYYTYKFCATEKQVKRESLTKHFDKNKEIIFKRTNNKLTVNNWFSLNDSFILRTNASVISTAHQYGISETNEIYDFFNQIYSNAFAMEASMSFLTSYSYEYYYKHNDVLKRAIEELKRFDTGIVNGEIRKLTYENGKTQYVPIFEHRTDAQKKDLIINEESTGTQKLFSQFLEIYFTMRSGGILIVDELDNHLHEEIVSEILRYFIDPEINIKGAQLLFTSHHSRLLDVAKKYRTYLFEKEDGSAFAYRIDEIKDKDLLRNDKPLSPVYRSGLIGGIPNVKK